jgi:hypothetical protein
MILASLTRWRARKIHEMEFISIAVCRDSWNKKRCSHESQPLMSRTVRHRHSHHHRFLFLERCCRRPLDRLRPLVRLAHLCHLRGPACRATSHGAHAARRPSRESRTRRGVQGHSTLPPADATAASGAGPRH